MKEKKIAKMLLNITNYKKKYMKKEQKYIKL